MTRGFLPSEDGQQILAKAREVILRTIEQSTPEEKMDWSVIKEKIRVELKRYLNKQTSKRPADFAGDFRSIAACYNHMRFSP